MISRQSELNSLLKDIMDYLYSFDNLQMSFLTNFFQFVDEEPNMLLNLDFFEIIELIKEKYLLDNVNELIFASFLKTLIQNNSYYESVPDFVAKLIYQNEALAEDFEKSIIFLSQELAHTKTMILFKIIKKFSFMYKDEEIVNHLLYWFLVGELFSSSQWVYNRPIFLLSEIDLHNTNIYDIIKNIMDARKHYGIDDVDSLTRIYRSSAGVFINEFGPEDTLNAYLRHYEQESNKNIRFSFHNSYISMLGDGLAHVEMILSFTSSFVRAERDISVLLDIFTALKSSYAWKTISYIALSILNHQEVRNLSKDIIQTKFYIPYRTDLILNNSLIFETIDIFIGIWGLVEDNQKHEMLIIFKEWIEDEFSHSTTIKKVFLQSLISNTTDIHWLHLLYQMNEVLGPSRVTILDEIKPKTIINFLEEEESLFENETQFSDLASNPEGLFCLGCRRKLNNIHAVEHNQCGNCLAIFCKNCYEIWFDHIGNFDQNYTQPDLFEEELTCLGSTLYGFNHNFVTTN
ncbi:MAG: hypothetical protein ACW981_10110 [Candidatus Hodarchaeales archaeon]|jgi:hypothetical protein